jgi:hypothetical protein
VAAPCDCEPAQLVDVAGVVATYQANNDDVALGIDPGLLANVQSDISRDLPCGRIYLTRISSNQATITLKVNPATHVVLVVGSYIETGSDFTITVPPDAELDLFVGDTITASGAFSVGNQESPARARTYVGGSTVNLRGASLLVANVYAPKATITLGGTAATLYGSIFASSLNPSADLTIHYDEAILNGTAGTSTPGCPAPSACSSPCDCAGQACNGGTCGPCTDSTQCCAPLVCVQGACLGAATQ